MKLNYIHNCTHCFNTNVNIVHFQYNASCVFRKCFIQTLLRQHPTARNRHKALFQFACRISFVLANSELVACRSPKKNKSHQLSLMRALYQNHTRILNMFHTRIQPAGDERISELPVSQRLSSIQCGLLVKNATFCFVYL